MRYCTVMLATLVTAAAAGAQSTQPSVMSPMLPASLSEGNGPEVLQPTIYPLAPSIDGDYVPPATFPSNLFREGVFLTQRDGKLFRGADGGLQFQPDIVGELGPDATLPPLTILPNTQLAALVPLLQNAADARVTLSGKVTAYKEQNYLLVQVAAPAGPPATRPDDTDDATLAAAKMQPTTRSNPATMAATDVLDQMLTPVPGNVRPLTAKLMPLIDSSTGASAIAPNAAELQVHREGSFVVDRTGRLRKMADGQGFEFVFETDGRAMQDPPMVVLPNLKLMSMENSVRGASRDVLFRITGSVTEYNGRNYLLLEKVVVPPEATQRF